MPTSNPMTTSTLGVEHHSTIYKEKLINLPDIEDLSLVILANSKVLSRTSAPLTGEAVVAMRMMLCV